MTIFTEMPDAKLAESLRNMDSLDTDSAVRPYILEALARILERMTDISKEIAGE